MSPTPSTPRVPVRTAALALALLALLAWPAAAQQPPLRVKVDKVRVGFKSYDDDKDDYYKPELWTPVHVTLTPDPGGNIQLPVAVDDFVRGELLVETPDNDGVASIYPTKFAFRKDDDLQILTYVKATTKSPQIKISVRTDAQTFDDQPQHFNSMEYEDQLYLSLGARLGDLQTALNRMSVKGQQNLEIRQRYAAYEDNVRWLPQHWFGYNGVDLVILLTDNQEFLKDLLQGASRQRRVALAEWVRRGGRLVVSVAWDQQRRIDELLKDKDAWQPPLPPLLRVGEAAKPWREAFKLKDWAVSGQRFAVAEGKAWVAPLEPRADVEVVIKETVGDASVPLMIRAPYGLGSVTVLAFDLKGAPFSEWAGRADFYKELVTKLSPRLQEANNAWQGGPGGGFKGGPKGQRFGNSNNPDLSARLSDEMDRFDTAPISFGWVAFFIFLYILVVGPLDYLILKKVFKRLEWTWVTFPTVVLVVSVSAYLIAYSVKGNELKINKIDLVELDLRTDLNDDQTTRRAYAYGTTWVTLLSPRIQNYTVGVEPVVNTWADPDARDELPPAVVSWMARPESSGGGGRQRAQGLFRRNYEYNYGALGVKDVPIPVWTTKAFQATWEAPLKKVPLDVKLEFDPKGVSELPFGTIKNVLPFDLEDVALLYGGKWYPLSDLPKGTAVAVKAEQRGPDLADWAKPRPGDQATDQTNYNPTLLLRELLFHEKSDLKHVYRNAALSGLDQSWRLRTDWPGLRPGPDGKELWPTREAILFARVAHIRGPAQTLTADRDPRLATQLWLGQLPGENKDRPTLEGNIAQDTYVRAYLPVRPKKQ